MVIIPHSAVARRLRLALRVIASALTVAGLAGACDAGSSQGDLPGCICEVDRCTSAACSYELKMDGACAADVTTAEVLIDGHLERERLRPGSTLRPCTRTEPGVTSEIYVRGGQWVWGPLKEQCETPGDVETLVLQCVEASR